MADCTWASQAGRGPRWRWRRCHGVLGGKREVALVTCLESKSRLGHVASQDGSTALVIAAERGHKDVLEVLLDRGADLGARAGVCQTSQLV